MVKRLFSLAMTICLATIGAWADDVTTIDQQTLWTFAGYAGQSTKVYNFGGTGLFLHSSQTASGFTDFSVDTEHVVHTGGTFTGTGVAWSATSVLVAGQAAGSDLLNLGNIDAASDDGAETSLAFNHSTPGKLYVIYGATTEDDGMFYIRQRKSSNTNFTTVYEKKMEGTRYTGPLATPQHRAASDYPFTLNEAVVSLDEAGTVYMGGSQPYCIYAILYLPDPYGIYDFQTWAEANMTEKNQATIVTAGGIMTGEFTPASGDINGTMPLNGAFSITGTSYKLRKNGSTGNVNSGLMIAKTAGAKLTINRLQAGDWFTITTDVANRLQFATSNANVHPAGSPETITQNSYVQSGTVYIATAATTVDVYSKDVGTVYIHKVQISNKDAVSVPVISVDESNQVTIDGGTSLKGDPVTVYYTTDNSDPATSTTRQVYSAPFTPTATVKVRAYSVLTSDATIVSAEAEPVAVRIGTWSGETNVFDFASAANNYVDITFGEAKLDGIRMYGGGNSQNASANFYPITNTDWLTASEGNTAAVAWRDQGATFKNGGLIPNGQSYFTIAQLTEGQRVKIEYYGQLRYRTNVADDAPVVLDESGTAIAVDTYFGTKNQDNTTTFTISSSTYMVFLCANNDVVIKKITILEPLPTYELTIGEMEHGTITDTEGNTLTTASYKEGTQITLVAKPDEDYKFDYWEVNGEKDTEHTTATLTLTVTAATTVKAHFYDARVSATGVPVIIVAGQSNTDGRIKTTETAFPYTLNHTLISYCNGDVNGSYPVVDEGNFVTYGTTPRSDAGECWGYDAIIYNKVQEALGGNTDFYVIKQSKGNTAVNAMSTSGNNQHWWSANPVWLDRNTSANKGGRSLLLALKDNIDKSLKVFDDANQEYDIKFLMWHQGESDRGKGTEYETQMKAVINYIRNYLVERTGNNKYSNLPVILGGIADVSKEYKAEVETGKQNIAAGDANVYYVPTGTMTLEEDFRSDKVHFNATGAEKLATKVWDVISTNKLLDGITLEGTDTPAEDLLKEDVVNKTTTWNFTAETTLVENQSMNGLYNHRGTVNQKDYGTITFADGSTIDGTYAATTNAADRKTSCTQGLTAGYTGLTYVYSVNVNSKGTFMAVIRPLGIKDATTTQYARLMLNGEELQAVAVTSTDENIQLVGKATGKGTFAITCGESWDFIGAKFIKGNSTVEILTAPTIEAGSKLNTIKINPGVSDQSDATVNTYYTTDGTTPSASSEEYTGGEVTLIKSCIVKAVSISSKGNTTYSEPYSFTLEAATDPVLLDFKGAYADNPSADLGMTDETRVTVYYHRSSDDTDRNGSFNYVTAQPYNSIVSVLSSGMSLTDGGLKVSGNRPFAIHGLKLGDVIRMEFSGSLYYAKHSSKGNALENMTIGDELESFGEYTISNVDAENNYVVFFPSATTTIAQISINKELVPYTITNYYISPDGNDETNSGIMSSPFKTLKKAQEKVESKGKIYILPGTYSVTNAEYMDKSNENWNVIYNLNKANVQYIGVVSMDGKRPVFDFSGVSAEDSKRITGFLLSSKNITIKNIETIGIQIPKISGDDTQSEFFRLNGASGCTLQNIAAHDGNGIGFYIHGKSKDNLIVDCDAYQNVDVINNTGENNDGFGCHVAAGYTGNKFLRCRAWNNADDGFDFLKCLAVVTADSCIAYANGMASGIDIKGNGNGIKAGGFGKSAFPATMEIPMHVVKNCIAVKNRKSGFYANHHLGGLQFESNRAYDNNPDFNMMNRSLESLTETIPENTDPRMEVDGYGHLLSNNIVYRNSDFDKLITYTNPSECTLAGNSFTYQNNGWTNKAYAEADFVSLAVSGLLKDRDATGKLPDAVFDFMKLKEAGEKVDDPVIVVKSQSLDKIVYSVTYPSDAELHYKLPGTDTETVTTEGSVTADKKTVDIEVTTSGGLIVWVQKGSNVSNIITHSSTIVTNAEVTLTDDSRKDQKTFQVVFGEKQKFYYMRPLQDTEPRSQSYKAEFAEKPFTVTVSNNGDFIYWTTETIDGSEYESAHDTITVNTIARKPTATYLSVEHSVSVYRIAYSKGTILHYTIGDGAEQTYSEKDTLELKVAATGMLTAYSKNDYVTSDTTSTRLYAPTPSVLNDGVYDFTLLREAIGADYTLTTWGYDSTLEIGGVTLKKPSAMTAKTFEGLALTAPVKNDSKATESNDWRLLNAGRLRASKSGNDKYLAIMGAKQGDYLTLSYNGAPVKYLPTGTARLSEGVDTLKTQKAYRIETSGDLLLNIPADTIQNCDITSINLISTETVEPPTIALKNDNIPNVVRIRVGKSSLGLSVSMRYTTDGADPKLEHGIESVKSPLDLTFDEDVTVKAVTVSESGRFSDVTTFKLTLPVSQPSASVVYDLCNMISNGIIACDTEGVGVYNKEYSTTDSSWTTKHRTDFMPLTATDGKLSVRSGSSSFQLQSDGTTVRLTRALAFHHLGVGDEIAIVYSGDGHLWSAGADEGDAFTINGEPATAGKTIPSGAILKVTKTKYANNYVVVTPSGPVSGKVYIKAIYINHEQPIEAHVPEVTLHEVEDTTATYRFTFDPHETLHYILEVDGTEETKQSAEGFFDLPITTSTKIQAWTTREAFVSDTLSMMLFAPTPASTTEGYIDFSEVSEALPADLEVTIDTNQPVSVEGKTLYKPSMLTAATFNDHFAFSQPTTANKIRMRTNHQLTFAKGEDLQMAILNLKAGDIVAIEYTGTILVNNPQNVRPAVSTGLQQLESGVSYEIQQDGDLLLTVSLADASVNILRMYIGSPATASEPAAINFAAAVEEFEELTVGSTAYVYYHGKSDAQKFQRLTNESFFLPIAGKLSAANTFTMTGGGFQTNGRIAIHNLAQRDSIRIRFNEGVVTYAGHATKGCVVSVRGRQLVSGDTLMTGDVIIVEKVDYLNNYVVLRLDGKGTVSGIFINSDESETVSAPTITDKGSNTVLITAGRSSTGHHVTTCYTTDGSEPTMYNGTCADGEYESFSVKLLNSGMVTIKAVTISDTGVSSSVCILTVYADKLVYGPSFLMDEDGNMYDVYNVWGQKVNDLQRGKLYIVNGKKVIYN